MAAVWGAGTRHLDLWLAPTVPVTVLADSRIRPRLRSLEDFCSNLRPLDCLHTASRGTGLAWDSLASVDGGRRAHPVTCLRWRRTVTNSFAFVGFETWAALSAAEAAVAIRCSS